MTSVEIRVISSSTVGDFRYGYAQFNCSLMPTELSNPIWNRIPGLDSNDKLQSAAPIVGTAGYAGLVNARSTPLMRDQKMHELIANISTLKGKHNAFGRWNFDPAYSRNPTSPWRCAVMFFFLARQHSTPTSQQTYSNGSSLCLLEHNNENHGN